MRLIDADALVEAVKDYPYGFRGMIECDIAKQPTIEPKKGKWTAVFIDYTDGTIGSRCECPFCKEQQLTWTNYCPNCGADMRERSEE